ncbi:MAG: oligosaccharide flippase family protein [Crocosphaera sp.]|nr:oligosaccharide flippase family protein [Crocosphaera sp.]
MPLPKISLSFLKNKAITGTLWTIIGYGGGQVLRLGSNLILTRLLIPELFGLMALATTFIQGLTLFSDIGIKPSIIRSSRGDDPTFLNTAWTLQVIRGFGLWIGCCIIAWPVSQFYDNQQLLWLLPTVGLTTIMSGFNSTSLATLNRKLDIGKLTLLQLGVQVLTLTIMIAWAYFQPSIWALVVGSLVSVFIKMAISHRLEPSISNRFVWDQESIKEIASFGRWILVSTMMVFLANQSDRLILGKLLPLEILGLYSIAFMFADLPKQIGGKLSHQVIFPWISQHNHLSIKAIEQKVNNKRRLINLFTGLLIAILVSFGDVIIFVLYDDRYIQAAWMLPILALGIWPTTLFITTNPILLALGKPYYGALGNSLKFLYMIICLPVFFNLFGILGAIIVISLNDIMLYSSVAYGIQKQNFNSLQKDIQNTIILVIAIFLLSTIRYCLGFGLSIETIL